MATTSRSLKSILLISLILLSLHFSLIYAHGGADDDDEDTHAPTSTKVEDHLHSKALVRVKIWCLVIFFVATFIPSMTPYFFQWNESFLVLGTQFSAGVFLATAMMHFLGDANSTFETLTDIEYPFAYMLACAGYLLTMSGDLVIAYVVGKSAEGQISVEEGGVLREGDDDRFKASEMAGTLDHHNPMFIKTNSFGDTLLLVFALCFHSVFEGIAVGIADTKADAWRNLWTISLHKVFAAVAMGIALLRMMPERPFLTSVGYSFAFAISSPIGVGIGIGIDATTEGKTADWIFAISMSLACGIFVYVAINHLIAKGYKPHSKCYFNTPLYKYLGLVLGVAVIAVVMKWD